jgi:hypothetical protein
MRSTRLVIIGAAAVAAVVLFLLLRPEEAETPPAVVAPTAGTEADATTAPPPTTTAPAAKPRPQVATIRIAIRGGRPSGGIRRARVRQGRRVRLLVRSDVADHVHLHGYDIFRDVAPGAPARLAFRATVPGRFEVELEDRGIQIAELEVRP